MKLSSNSNPPSPATGRVDRDAGAAERLDVAQHGALADLELGCELAGAHPAVGLQQTQQRDEPAGAHAAQISRKS